MTESSIRIPRSGEIVAGKYRLLRLLGEGGMGMVMAAEHLRLRRSIAIKFLNPSMLGIAEIIERFDREARAAATLRSRHVVRVTDVEQTPEGVPYMVMELLDGSDLELERARRGRLPHAEAVDYVLQACGALAEAHAAGIVHRDLKPGNLFLAREGGDHVIVKVLDFGISKFLEGEDSKLTSAGAVMGTALYMSPEQVRGDSTIDARSDIWSLGVILYELISGDAPWIGPATRVAAAVVSEPVPDLRSRCVLPEPLARVIHGMLEKNRAARPQSIAEVAEQLAPFAPPGSVGAEVAEQLARKSQRSFGMGGGRSSMPSQPTLGASSDPTIVSSPQALPVVPTARVNPERSTMAATTTSADVMRGRPRAIMGVLVGFATLAIAGLVLIVFVARSKTAATTSGADPVDPSTTAVVVTAPTSVEPAPSPSVTSPSTSTMTSAGSPQAAQAAASASAAVAAKKAPLVGTATASSARQPRTDTTPSRPPTKPQETAAQPAANPLFLK